MDMYLTAGSDRFRIPLLPNKVSVKRGTTSISFQIIKTGEHKIPRGTAVTGYSWTGVFPGESMSDLGFVFDWIAPKYIIDKLTNWMTRGEKLDFLISGAGVKDTVFIDSFTYDYAGRDNVNYTLSLSAYRPVTVTSAPPQPKIEIPKENPNSPSYQAQAGPGASNSSSSGTKSSTPNNKKTKLSVTIPKASVIAGVASAVAVAAKKTAVVAAVKSVTPSLPRKTVVPKVKK